MWIVPSSFLNFGFFFGKGNLIDGSPWSGCVPPVCGGGTGQCAEPELWRVGPAWEVWSKLAGPAYWEECPAYREEAFARAAALALLRVALAALALAALALALAALALLRVALLALSVQLVRRLRQLRALRTNAEFQPPLQPRCRLPQWCVGARAGSFCQATPGTLLPRAFVQLSFAQRASQHWAPCRPVRPFVEVEWNQWVLSPVPTVVSPVVLAFPPGPYSWRRRGSARNVLLGPLQTVRSLVFAAPRRSEPHVPAVRGQGPALYAREGPRVESPRRRADPERAPQS